MRKSLYFSFLVFCFYSFLLVLPGGYSLFAVLLGTFAIAVLLFFRPLAFLGSDRLFALFLALYPLLMIPSLLFKGGTWGFFDYPVRALLFIPLIIALRSLANAGEFQRALLLGCNVGGILSALFCLKLVLLDHVVEVGPPVAQSIAYGQIAAIMGLISFAFLFKEAPPVRRVIAWLGFFGSVFTVTASSSTGALLGFVFGLMALVLFRFKDQLNRFHILGVFVAALLAVVFLLPLIFVDLPRIISDVQNYKSGAEVFTSQGQRLLLWGMAIKEIFISPVFGIGPGHFDAVMHRYCAVNPCTSQFSGFHGVHNQFLDSGMNAGMVGLLGLLMSYLGPLVLFGKRISSPSSSCSSSEAARAGVAVILAGMISGLSQVLYGHNISVLSYFLTITFLWYLANQPPFSSTRFDMG
jgi:O-antigen ligase